MGNLRTEGQPIRLTPRQPAAAPTGTALAPPQAAATPPAPPPPQPTFTPPPPAATQAQPLQTGPAASPEEHETRKSGWRSFITGLGDKFQSDPEFRSFMFNLGTRLMQPYGPEQTGLGHLGASLQGAQNYSAALGAQRAAGAQSGAEAAADIGLKGARADYYRAQAARGTRGAPRGATESMTDALAKRLWRVHGTKKFASADEAWLEAQKVVSRLGDKSHEAQRLSLAGVMVLGDESEEELSALMASIDEIMEWASGEVPEGTSGSPMVAELETAFPNAEPDKRVRDPDTGIVWVRTGDTWVEE